MNMFVLSFACKGYGRRDSVASRLYNHELTPAESRWRILFKLDFVCFLSEDRKPLLRMNDLSPSGATSLCESQSLLVNFLKFRAKKGKSKHEA